MPIGKALSVLGGGFGKANLSGMPRGLVRTAMRGFGVGLSSSLRSDPLGDLFKVSGRYGSSMSKSNFARSYYGARTGAMTNVDPFSGLGKKTRMPQVSMPHQVAATVGAGVGMAAQYGAMHNMFGMNLFHFAGLQAGHFYGTRGYAPKKPGFAGAINPLPAMRGAAYGTAGAGAVAGVGGVLGLMF